MTIFAGIGLLTTLLELAAISIGAGIVVVGFIAAGVGMLSERSRKEMEGSALRDGFWGGFWGMFCLCIDLIMRYPGLP